MMKIMRHLDSLESVKKSLDFNDDDEKSTNSAAPNLAEATLSPSTATVTVSAMTAGPTKPQDPNAEYVGGKAQLVIASSCLFNLVSAGYVRLVISNFGDNLRLEADQGPGYPWVVAALDRETGLLDLLRHDDFSQVTFNSIEAIK